MDLLAPEVARPGIHGRDFRDESVRHLFARDQKKGMKGQCGSVRGMGLSSAEEGVQSVDRRQRVVIRENEKVVTLLAIEANDVDRTAVAVGVDRVGVRVSLVPTSGLRVL